MIRRATAPASALAACLLIALPATAAPTILALQGHLATASGGPVSDGKYGLSVSLYDAAEAGATLFKEKFVGVAVSGGIFAVELGADNVPLDSALFVDGGSRFFGVSVDGEPELPIAPLRATPYSLRAEFAAAAATLACTGCVDGAMIAASAIGADHLAVNAVESKHVAFTFAGSASKAGPADEALHAKNADNAAEAVHATSADSAETAKTAASATIAESAKQADKAGFATTAEELQCSGCVTLNHLAKNVAEGFVATTGGTVSGALAVQGGLDLGGSTLSGANLAAVDVAQAACTDAEAGRVALDTVSKSLHFCDGAVWQRLIACAGVCKAAQIVPCGDSITTDCGDPGGCKGKGTLCEVGLKCGADGCVTPGQTKEFPAASCASLLAVAPETKDGAYWVDPNGGDSGDAFQVYCDMTSDGGGWAMVVTIDGDDEDHSNVAQVGSVPVLPSTPQTSKFADTVINALIAENQEASIRFICDGTKHFFKDCEFRATKGLPETNSCVASYSDPAASQSQSTAACNDGSGALGCHCSCASPASHTYCSHCDNADGAGSHNRKGCGHDATGYSKKGQVWVR